MAAVMRGMIASLVGSMFSHQDDTNYYIKPGPVPVFEPVVAFGDYTQRPNRLSQQGRRKRAKWTR